MRGQCSLRNGFRSATLILSMPAAPLFPTTRAWAAIMFSRLTTNSISRTFASGRECADLAVALDAPIPCSGGFRPLPSGRAWGVSTPSSASPVAIERPAPVRRLMFGPSPIGSIGSYGLC